MFAYSTNLPYYFDYVASAMTRQDILDDPKMCHLLEDPRLKDNMEMALHYKSAKRGGYNEKKEFLEYFFCNGPELEPDTILYYREKCFMDPIYLQIAEIEFSNIEIIDQLRTSKYKKSNDLEDCFTKPCNYLGPFGSSIGMMGDSNNFLTLSNIFAKKKKEMTEGKSDNKDSDKPGEGTKDEDGDDTVWGNVRQHVTNKLIPKIRIQMQTLYNNMQAEMKGFADRAKDVGVLKHISLGDPVAIDRSEAISAASKINIFNRMGDCARLWQHMRKFNAYDPEKNKKEPIPDDAVVANKSPQGTSIDSTPKTSVKKKVSASTTSQLAANGDKVSQAIELLNNLPYPITASDIAKLKAPDTEVSKEEKLELWNSITAKLNSGRADYRNATYKIAENAGIKDSGDAFARWTAAVDARDAKNEELNEQFWECQNLINAIRAQESGIDQDETIISEPETKLWESDDDVVIGSEQEQAAAAMAAANQDN